MKNSIRVKNALWGLFIADSISMPLLDERYHYHHGLEAGDNTLGANLVRVLPNATDENMITSRFATACYPEHGVPLILHFLYKNNFTLKENIL